MPTIRPISELRNNFSQISEIVHSDDEPIFLTKNGIGDMVVMSIDLYERQIAQIDLYQKLAEARQEIANGAKGRDAGSFIQGLMQA
ncbi:MAG: type II toxin-antitoxin system Phd/YefM family antitoxin [Treponema sp.]|nr:type II toxin-antitoxin system Phd/YefM family antitoxin [Treponema sp.]